MIAARAWLTVFRASCLHTLLSPGVWAMVATCVLSSFASIFHNHQRHLEAMDQYEVHLQERLRLQVHSMAGPTGRETDRSLRVLRPPGPAATFVAGVERTMPSGWDFGPAGAETLPPYTGTGTLATLDVLVDGESVVRLFGGMLAIGLGFWTVTRDRQRGWLAAAPWLPVPRWWVMSTLLAAGSAVVGVIALVWIAASASFALWLSDPAAQAPSMFVETWLLVWIYLVTMFGIGALIARLTTNALVGMAAVVATWTMLIFLGPQLATTLVRMTSPTQTRVRFEQERREIYADLQKEADDALAASLVAAVPANLERPDVTAAVTAAFPSQEPTWRDNMVKAREESTAANRTWLDTQWRQLERLQTIARFSPGALLQSALATAHGQSWATQRMWGEAITRHEAALSQALFDDRSTITLRIPWTDQLILWTKIFHATRSHAELPQFDVAATVASVDRSALPADLFAGLLQVTAVLFAAALVPPRSRS